MNNIVQDCPCISCMDRSIPVSVLSEKELEIFCNNSVKIFFQKGERIIKQGTYQIRDIQNAH